MCGAKLLALCLCSAVSLSLSGQSFDPDATYQVSGAELNQLESDLLTAKAELATLRIENAKLVDDSKSKALALIELQTQLMTVSESLGKLKTEALARDWSVGLCSFGSGALTAIVYYTVSRLTN